MIIIIQGYINLIKLFYLYHFSQLILKFYNIPKIFKSTNKHAPGIPKIPTTTELIMLKPIWKLKDVPTKFIKKIIKAPRSEFPISFIIFFRGNEKYFPNTIKIAIHAINTKIILLSIFYNCPFLVSGFNF